jgi:protein-tyrosine phosphatase
MQSLDQFFHRSNDFIDRQRKSTNVLVHCYAGISRSTTIVLAYLIYKYKWTLAEALRTVSSIRKIVCPNPGFMR